MSAPTHWPEADCQEALRLKDCGLTWREVGWQFGKSKSATQAACRRYQGYKLSGRSYSENGPPIGIEKSETSFRRNTKTASDSLRRAIQSLFERMPERKVLEIVGTQPAPIPGTERIYYGHLAQRALAA